MSLQYSTQRFDRRPAQRCARWAGALLAAAVALVPLVLPAKAQAQTTDPPYKPFGVPPSSTVMLSTEKQSTVNPFPMGGGNAQGRTWGADDFYWGVLDGNVPFNAQPLARGGLQNTYLALDGWQFPRLTDAFNTLSPLIGLSDPNGLNHSVLPILTATAFVDGEAPTTNAPAPVNGPAFGAASTPTPSTNVTSTNLATVPDYYEGIAFPRPSSSALSYDANNKFTWRLDNPTPGPLATLQTVTIPGAAGVQQRYRIFVHVPAPASPVGNTSVSGSTLPENRVSDARYTVYYYANINGTYQARQLVCQTVAQTDGGDVELRAADGSEPVFPLFSSATFTAKGVATGVTLPAQPAYPSNGQATGPAGTPTNATPILQGVVVDNTTADSTTTVEFVIADSITLQPTTSSITATPTITSQHGGALTVASGGTTSIPIQPNTFLPDSPDAAYNGTTNTPPHMSDPNNVFADATNLFSYANDINDPQYAGAGYVNYTPWDVSTYFQGPRSLIDPRYVGTDANNNAFAAPGPQIGPIDPYISDRPLLTSPANPAAPVVGQDIYAPAKARDATNNTVYAAPYFSHAQILVSRTQFVQDPENGVSAGDRTGVATIQVGEIVALDWQTGAPVWRFPDRSYLPAGATFRGAADSRAPACATRFDRHRRFYCRASAAGLPGSRDRGRPIANGDGVIDG